MPANLNVVFGVDISGVKKLAQAQGAVDKFGRDTERSMKKHFSSMKNLALYTGGIVAFETVRRTISKSIDEYAKQEEAVARLTNVLGYESKALLELAGARQKTTKYSDEDTIAAAAEMGVLIKNESRLKILIPLVQDFASAKGIDLNSAASLVSKTLQSETNALQRQGISVTGAAGSTERFTKLVNKLTDAVGGNAEAVGKTGAGQMKIFQNSIDELYENLGKSLMPTMIKITGYLNTNLVPAISGLIEEWSILTGASLNDPIRDLTIIDDKIIKIKKDMENATTKKGWRGFINSWFATDEENKNVAAEIGKNLPELQKNRDELQKQVDDIMNPHSPNKKKAKGKDDIVSTKAGKETTKGLSASGIALKQLEDDYKAAVEGNKAFYALQKEKDRRIEDDYNTAAQQLNDFRQTEQMINQRYDQAMQSQSRGTWNYELDEMRMQHAYELAEIKTTGEQRLKLISAQAVEEQAVVDQTNTMKFNAAINTGDAILSAAQSAMEAAISIDQKHKEELRPIMRAIAIMRFAAGTASGIEAAWESSGGSWPVGLALSLATVVENAAMMATQLSAINSAATGADFVATKPQLLMVGDNPTRRERVQVTPIGSPNLRGPQGGQAGGPINIYVNDALTGDRLIRAIRSGSMRSGMADLKRALANA
jgi:hypothetical protein